MAAFAVFYSISRGQGTAMSGGPRDRDDNDGAARPIQSTDGVDS